MGGGGLASRWCLLIVKEVSVSNALQTPITLLLTLMDQVLCSVLCGLKFMLWETGASSHTKSLKGDLSAAELGRYL